ncbi:GNAT family N-acetyltransferase [Levilactobacillus bambusae]|uniref:GNAT family N-acetyltransferase n=1 Tax=Levilactobacillus bambusae TaxID=2024736 RepID=A0A2V1MYW3_9LACO|nr:GNAT family N-acetyltransferase [Levilactobacillus bambusae]PWG00002.1 GNAT family N-acetyltransferase [Levilactobacillus bambusae]
MLLRQATMADLPQIETIISDGRDLLAKQNIDQWQGTYPDMSILVDDIEQGFTVVLEEDGEILGTTAVIPGVDPLYVDINGEWLTKDTPYVALHRVAVSSRHHGRGLANELLTQIFNLVDQSETIQSIRIDTHPDNLGMQHVIKKAGFTETGRVKLVGATKNNGDVDDFAYERLAHQPVAARV